VAKLAGEKKDKPSDESVEEAPKGEEVKLGSVKLGY